MTRVWVLALIGLCAMSVLAANNIFLLAEGPWSVSNNWSLGSVPSGSDNAVINNGNTATITSNAPSVDNVTVGNGPFSNTTLFVRADLSATLVQVAWSSNAIGAIDQSNGTLRISSAFTIASTQSKSDFGRYVIHGGSLLFSNATVSVGTQGRGVFTIDGARPAEVRGNALTIGTNGTLVYNLDMLGVTPIRLTGSLTVNAGGRLVVDGTDYEGLDGYFPLLTASSQAGVFAATNVSFIGLSDRAPALVVQTNGLWLRLTAPPAVADELLSLTPQSTVAGDYVNSQFSVTRNFEPSMSPWGLTLNEAHVMDTRLSQTVFDGGAGQTNRSWDLRVGRGGQLYSLRTPALGETVPPQKQNPTDTAPWVDEVWQGVSVSPLNDPPASPYFIHQAGIYWKQDPALAEPFFSPQVASQINPIDRSFTTINWGQQANPSLFLDGVTSNDWRSHLLYYTRYRDLGQGVIEMTLGYFNYGPDLLNWLNAPWGGVRRTSTEYAFLSRTNGVDWLGPVTNEFGSGNINYNQTGGWSAFCASSNGVTPSLGLVFGRDGAVLPANQYMQSLYRYGYAGAAAFSSNPTNWRNYFVSSNIRGYNIAQGQGLWSRHYFVMGDNLADLSSRIASRGLVGVELREFDYRESSTPLIGYNYAGNGVNFRVVKDEASPAFYLYAHPVGKSLPVFEIIKNDYTRCLTWNPYAAGITKPYDGTLAGIRLLGFAMRGSNVNQEGKHFAYTSLSNVLAAAGGAYLPDGEELRVRIQDFYGEWVSEHDLDAINVNTSAVLNTVADDIGGYLKRGSVGFVKYSPTSWTISGGVLSNASASNNNLGESVLGRIIDLTSLSNGPQDKLTLRFDYSTAESGERLYVHLWGYVDTSSTPNTLVMNLSAPNGNAWEASAGAMTPYNLGKSNGVFTGTAGYAGDAAAVLTGSSGAQVFSNLFDLSTFTTAPNTVSGYDYIAIGFGREVGGTIDPALSIRNVVLSVVGGDVLLSFEQERPARDPVSDPDGDGLVNAFEYGVGGDPTNAVESGLMPIIGMSATGGMEYVYRRRTDAAARRLFYLVQQNSNLLTGTWSTNGIQEAGKGYIDDGFERVTNRVIVDPATAVRLRMDMRE